MSGALWTSYVVLWVLVITLAAAVFAMYHHFAQTYLMSPAGRSEQGPNVGSTFPEVQVDDIDGVRRPLIAPGVPSLLLFLSTECTSCNKLRSALCDYERPLPPMTIVVAGATDTEVRQWAEGLPAVVVPDTVWKLTTRLKVGLVPFCIALDDNGQVSSRGLVNDLHGIQLASADATAATRFA